MNNTQIRAFVRQLITENKVAKSKKMKPKKMDKTSVGNRLKMIDEAGDKASLQAKIATIDNDIKEANEIKAAIPQNVSHFVSPEIISDLHDDLAKSIEELKAKKAELEDQMSEMNAPAKETKKPTEESKELEEAKKPSASMTKKAKSTLVKKAKAFKK
jgi:hypothetical protein